MPYHTVQCLLLQGSYIPANCPYPAVVLLLSKEFVSKPYPMEELQLLLGWKRQGSPAKLLPVFYNLTCKDLYTIIARYKAEAAQGSAFEHVQKKQWVEDLEGLLGITGLRNDQVFTLHLPH
jgi:hypothetical protein